MQAEPQIRIFFDAGRIPFIPRTRIRSFLQKWARQIPLKEICAKFVFEFFRWLFAGLRGVFFNLFAATRAAILSPVHIIMRAHVINDYRPSRIVVDIKNAGDFTIKFATKAKFGVPPGRALSIIFPFDFCNFSIAKVLGLCIRQMGPDAPFIATA